MEYKQLIENWDKFASIIQENNTTRNEITATLIERYLTQNAIVLNDLLSCNIDYLQKMQAMQDPNEIICTQAKLSTELSKKLMNIAQQFMNASLSNAADYNHWLKGNVVLQGE